MKKIIYILLLLFTFALIPFTLQAQPTQEWVRRYGGSDSLSDFVSEMVLDTLGNIYVTGSTQTTGQNSNFVTIKYNSNGVQQWIAIYNGPGTNSIDDGVAICVDRFGNVYVAGNSEATGFLTDDYATIKYNSNGVQQWVSRYNGTGNGMDDPTDIIVDNSGNIFVTGRSRGSSGNDDYLTIKYNSNGDSLWTRRYNGPGNGLDGALALALDSFGNVIVTGTSFGSSSDLDCSTIKYDTGGNIIWVVRYPSNGQDIGRKIVCDRQNNVIVLARIDNFPSTSDDFLTVKYSSGGVQQWAKIYNGTLNSTDEPNGLTLDTSDNVIVAGSTRDSLGGTNYVTIKYLNSNGNQVWISKYNGLGNDNDEAYSISSDKNSNIYVTGRSTGIGTNWDIVTIKYNISGMQEWIATYNGISNREDLGKIVKIDNDNNVIITGTTFNQSSNQDIVTIKYSQPNGIQPLHNSLPSYVKLFQNYPNPFNPTTNIEFQVSELRLAQLKIYDILGKEIETLINENLKPGSYSIVWNSHNQPSGVYFYKLSAGDITETRKMIIIK